MKRRFKTESNYQWLSALRILMGKVPSEGKSTSDWQHTQVFNFLHQKCEHTKFDFLWCLWYTLSGESGFGDPPYRGIKCP